MFSCRYFTEKEKFNVDDFEKEVINEPMVVETFRKYKDDFSKQYEIPVSTSFEIPQNAVKNARQFFKSVLKLDKNFHVYIHGRHDYVEKGFSEEKGMNYYTFYYNEEM